jgi:hypothetical protein
LEIPTLETTTNHPCREKPAIVCIDFAKDGRIIVNSKQPLLPGGVWNKQPTL